MQVISNVIKTVIYFRRLCQLLFTIEFPITIFYFDLRLVLKQFMLSVRKMMATHLMVEVKLVMLLLVGKQSMIMKWILMTMKRLNLCWNVYFVRFFNSFSCVLICDCILAQEADPRYTSTKSNKEDKTTAAPSEFSCTERNGPLSMPLAALGFVTRFATGLFSRGKKAEQPELEHLVGEGEETEVLEGETADVKHGFDTSDALDKHNPQNGLEITEECNNNSLAEDTEMQMGKDLGGLKSVEIDADGTRSQSEAGFFDFKHFDITENPLDHHFLGGSGQV